ncbi:4525_t:CDS:1, partial [Acaulospora morrowiae]
TLAACGDVNRNVMCSPNPHVSEIHGQMHEFAKKLSAHLSPQTTAYHEIWLDDKIVSGRAVQDFEPLYGSTYLPRKFKIAIAVPPNNDVDVYAHDLGFIAIAEKGKDKLLGYNVTVGGGMGMTHNNKKTYPRLGELLGFCKPDQAVDVAEKVMLVQRDFGDRTN